MCAVALMIVSILPACYCFMCRPHPAQCVTAAFVTSMYIGGEHDNGPQAVNMALLH